MAQEHFDRLTAIDASFLHQEGPTSHMHVGARHDLRGAAAAVTSDVLDHAARAPAPRAALPPEAGDAAAADRAGRCGSTTRVQPRVPRPPDRAAAPRLRGAAAAAWPARIFSQQLDRSKPLWEMWIVEGLDGAARLRADLQDPPRAHRRHRGRRPRPGPLRPRPGPGRAAPPRRGRGSPQPEPTAARARWPAARSALVRTGVRRPPRAAVDGHAPGRARAARGARGGRGRRRGRLGRR